MSDIKKIKIFLGIIFIATFSYSFISIRVSKYITEEDKEITKLLKVDKECSKINSYINEIKCIKSVQESQLQLIKGKKCRGKFINLGSPEVIDLNTACCFDRSRITEQALQIYGFKVRHVHLNETSKRGYLSLIVPKTSSHAVSEVLTSKGWLGVDSNEPFVLLDKNNYPNTFDKGILTGLINSYSKSPFYKKSMTYVIGLYSRNGTFFKPYLPFIPELNFNDFFKNLFNLKIIKQRNNIN
tara:strand:+ start:134 stop:856 length:723 start_codon:yes stop_codon:yes gene_type:complete